MLERPLACAALAALLGFSELMADSSGLGKYKLALYDPGRWVGGGGVVGGCVCGCVGQA